MHPQYRGVAFLLSLGSLPIACGKNDTNDTGDTTGTGPGPATSTDGNSTTGGTTGPVDPTTGDGQSGTVSTTIEPGTTNPETTSPTVSTFETDTFSETGPPDPPPPPENPVCQSYLAHLEMCMPGDPYNASNAYYCDGLLAYAFESDGKPCLDAFEAVFACINGLACGVEPEVGCMNQVADAETKCPNFFGGGIDTDTGGTGTSG